MNWLALGQNFNIGYFCKQILGPFSEILHINCITSSPRPRLHFDSPTPHQH
jgi:hypothetical protein